MPTPEERAVTVFVEMIPDVTHGLMFVSAHQRHKMIELIAAQIRAAVAEASQPDLVDLKHTLDSALEHFSHGWQRLYEAGLAPQDYSLPIPAPICTAAYHFSAVEKYVKRVYSALPDLQEA